MEAALPKLLARVHGTGLRAIVLAPTAERIKDLNKLLWTFDPDSFLPHGAKGEGAPKDQPIFLTDTLSEGDENPNGATVLVLVDGADDGAETGDTSGFDRCLYMFDGNDPSALEAARARWRRCAEGTEKMTYWQQSENGGWEEKASANAAEPEAT